MFFIHCSAFSGRAFELHRYWQRLNLPPGLIFNYTFINLMQENTTDRPNIETPENYMNWREYPHKEGKWTIPATVAFFWAFKWAIQYTTARWIFIGDDDILINFKLLLPFMRELDRKYDPINEVAVRGDCIINGPVYPQGGSGVVLSRRAVECLSFYGNYSLWGFWLGGKDLRLGRVMNEIFLGTSWYTSTAFMGHMLLPDYFRRLQKANFTVLAKCPEPETLPQSGCRRFVSSLRQIVFFHVGQVFENGPGWLKERLKLAETLWNAPPQVGFWPAERYRKYFCWGETQNMTSFW
jgi:hypothetical protein